MQVNSIAEQLFFTTVRIETEDSNGKMGLGTGFLFTHKIGEQEFHFVVTNKHVVIGQAKTDISFHRGQNSLPMLGNRFLLNLQTPMWFGHHDENIDIAIHELTILTEHIQQNYNVELFYRTISSKFIPTKQQIESLDALEFITFVGYPNGLWDDVNFLPIMRRGITATPIAVDFNGMPQFLIDASVFGGSSGSPVFIYDQGSFATKEGFLGIGSRLYFVGVVSRVYFKTSFNRIVQRTIPTNIQTVIEQKEMIDIGVVYKSHTIVETIEDFLSNASAMRISAASTARL
jgi:hypothetical protein